MNEGEVITTTVMTNEGEALVAVINEGLTKLFNITKDRLLTLEVDRYTIVDFMSTCRLFTFEVKEDVVLVNRFSLRCLDEALMITRDILAAVRASILVTLVVFNRAILLVVSLLTTRAGPILATYGVLMIVETGLVVTCKTAVVTLDVIGLARAIRSTLSTLVLTKVLVLVLVAI